MKQGTL